MKALFITLLIFAAALLVYDRFLTPPGGRLVFENPSIPFEEEISGHAAGTVSETAMDSGVPGGAIAASAGGSAFVPPQVPALEVLTQKWTIFPPSAFPRHVKLSKAVTLQLENGNTMELPAGSHAVAVGAQANVLGIALTETSPACGHAFVHDTDLPAQVRASYERWKKGQVESALVAWKKRQSQDNAPAGLLLPGAVDHAGMPMRNRSGGYDLLLASVNSGDVTDIKLSKVRRWSNPQIQTIDGQSTWVVSVFYETMAFCGPVDAEARAHVRNGQIIRWVYPSGEPVP